MGLYMLDVPCQVIRAARNKVDKNHTDAPSLGRRFDHVRCRTARPAALTNKGWIPTMGLFLWRDWP